MDKCHNKILCVNIHKAEIVSKFFDNICFLGSNLAN